jgi:hypothetical protein
MAEARVFRRAHRRSANMSLRRRLFTSPLITNPGNLDLEYSGAFDTNGSYTLPGTLKYTPLGWRTEFSAGVDSVASVVDDSGDRDTHFSDHVNLAATTAFHAGEHFDWAVAPTASFFLRGESGARLGGALIGRYDRANNTFSAAATWSGATRRSDTNPAGLMDVNLGYGRQLSKRWNAYGSAQWERASGVASQYSVFEGVEFQVNERFAVDLSGQHYALNTGARDHQIVVGITCTVFRHK